MSPWTIQLIFDLAMLVSGVFIGKLFFNKSTNEFRNEIRGNVEREMKYVETIRTLERELTYEKNKYKEYERDWTRR